MKDTVHAVVGILNIAADLFTWYACIMAALYLGHDPLMIMLFLALSFFLWPLRLIIAVAFFPVYTGIPLWASTLFVLRNYLAVLIYAVFLKIEENRKEKTV